jgi:hypothetical protein
VRHFPFTDISLAKKQNPGAKIMQIWYTLSMSADHQPPVPGSTGREEDEITITLYRPVGEGELELIRGSGYRIFPPRLSGQPIFYPVLNEEYAAQIARDWNTKDEKSGFAGYVTRFEVRVRFLKNYEIHRVGGDIHYEYWIPAEDLAAFNENIVGPIKVIATYHGSGST